MGLLVCVFVVVELLGLIVRVLIRFLILLVLIVHYFHVAGHVVPIGLVLCHQVHVLLLGNRGCSWLR